MNPNAYLWVLGCMFGGVALWALVWMWFGKDTDDGEE